MSIYRKLLELQKCVTGLKKDVSGDGRFTFSYTSGEKILSILRPKMDEIGLLLKTEVLDLEHERMDYSAKSGPKSEVLYKAKMKFTWIDCDTGEKDENLFAGTGFNNWEKGFGSSLTYGERYFLMKFFHLQTDKDDVDNIPSTNWESGGGGKLPSTPPKNMKSLSSKKEINVKKQNIINQIENICRNEPLKTYLFNHLGKIGIESLKELDEKKLYALRDHLNKRKKKQSKG